MHFCPSKSVFMSQNVAEITLWQLHGVASTSTSSTQRDLSRCHDVVQRIDPKQVADHLGPSWAIRAGDQTDTVTYSDYFHSLFMAFPLNDHLIQDEMDENQESSPRKGSITIHYVYVHDTPNSFVFFPQHLWWSLPDDRSQVSHGQSSPQITKKLPRRLAQYLPLKLTFKKTSVLRDKTWQNCQNSESQQSSPLALAQDSSTRLTWAERNNQQPPEPVECIDFVHFQVRVLY